MLLVTRLFVEYIISMVGNILTLSIIFFVSLHGHKYFLFTVKEIEIKKRASVVPKLIYERTHRFQLPLGHQLFLLLVFL